MKTFLFICLSFLCLASSVSYEVKKSTAEVNQVEGLYIYTDCKPVQEYIYLGSVKSTGSLNNPQYTNVRDYLIKKAHKEYENADAVILSLNAGGQDVCDVIRFQSPAR